ncbi:hypothetical protein QVM86_02815 [Providencia stuartii]|nr:hypothetical protein [Providencia stuartii]
MKDCRSIVYDWKVLRVAQKNSNADFVFESGPAEGKTVDFLFTTNTGKQEEILKFNQYVANNNWSRNVKQITDHLGKADIVPIDTTALNAQNKAKLIEYLNTLSNEQKKKIILLER